jgi:hypothetical protein
MTDIVVFLAGFVVTYVAYSVGYRRGRVYQRKEDESLAERISGIAKVFEADTFKQMLADADANRRGGVTGPLGPHGMGSAEGIRNQAETFRDLPHA